MRLIKQYPAETRLHRAEGPIAERSGPEENWGVLRSLGVLAKFSACFNLQSQEIE